MYLIIDLGNTNKKMAVIAAGKLLPKAFAAMQNQVVSSPEISRKSIKEFTRNRPAVEACILSSVVPFPASLSAWLGKQFRYLELSEDTPLPILNLYRSPATLATTGWQPQWQAPAFTRTSPCWWSAPERPLPTTSSPPAGNMLAGASHPGWVCVSAHCILLRSRSR